MTHQMTDARPIAIVTGASRRVGRAIAVELAAAGYDLVLTYNRSRSDIEMTTEECRIAAENAGATLEAALPSASASSHADEDGSVNSLEIALHQVDLSDEESITDFADWVQNHLPRLDALIHNAARYARTAFGEIEAGEVFEHFQINALAPLLITQSLAPLLQRSRGTVVLFSDIHVMGRPRKHLAAYNMSKAAASQLVHSLARELAPEVRVLGIAPGVIAWPDDADPGEIERYESRIPLEHSGTPQDAARLVRFLVSNHEAPYLTGEIIRLDGGRFLT